MSSDNDDALGGNENDGRTWRGNYVESASLQRPIADRLSA
jgi:hypothetical protein